MKKLINLFDVILFSTIIFCSCNTDNSQSNESFNNSTNAETNQNNDNISNAYADLPASKYFKIDSIIEYKYISNGKFEMKYIILNNSDYKFSTCLLRNQIFYKMKDEKEICTTTIQDNDTYPSYRIENWEPHTKKQIHFISPCKSCLGACWLANYERTPESIELVLQILKAISVDVEVEGAFAKYDILPLWKERQVKEGLR